MSLQRILKRIGHGQPPRRGQIKRVKARIVPIIGIRRDPTVRPRSTPATPSPRRARKTTVHSWPRCHLAMARGIVRRSMPTSPVARHIERVESGFRRPHPGAARWGRANRQRRSLPADFGENRRRSGKTVSGTDSAPIRRLRPQAAPRHCHAWRENRDRFSHAPLSPILRDPSAGWTCPRCAA